MPPNHSHPVGPDLSEIEEELARYRRGVTPGQLAFDLLFGIATPLALLWADPAIFSASVARRAVLPPYWAAGVYVVAGCLMFLLVVWLLSGTRVPWLGVVLAGPFAVGFLLAVGLGAKLLLFATIHADSLSGLLAFTPWLTAFVFARHCVRAIRAGAEASVGFAGSSLVVGTMALLLVLAAVAGGMERAARIREDMLFSRNARDREDAIAEIIRKDGVDFDRVALAYHELDEKDPRRPHIAEAYLRLTGQPIRVALRRLGAIKEQPPKQKGPQPAAETPKASSSTPPEPAKPTTAQPTRKM